MSIRIIQRIWDYSQEKGVNRLALVAIADNCNDEGIAWTGGNTLGKKLGESRQAAMGWIDKLTTTSELMVYPRDGKSNVYIVTTGMTIRELKAAIKMAAKLFKISTHDLALLRHRQRSAAQARLSAKAEKAPAKIAALRGVQGGVAPHDMQSGVAGGCKAGLQGVQSGVARTVNEPSLEPSSVLAADAAEERDERSRLFNALLFHIWGIVYEKGMVLPKKVSGGRIGRLVKVLREIGCTAKEYAEFADSWKREHPNLSPISSEDTLPLEVLSYRQSKTPQTSEAEDYGYNTYMRAISEVSYGKSNSR